MLVGGNARRRAHNATLWKLIKLSTSSQYHTPNIRFLSRSFSLSLPLASERALELAWLLLLPQRRCLFSFFLSFSLSLSSLACACSAFAHLRHLRARAQAPSACSCTALACNAHTHTHTHRAALSRKALPPRAKVELFLRFSSKLSQTQQVPAAVYPASKRAR